MTSKTLHFLNSLWEGNPTNRRKFFTNLNNLKLNLTVKLETKNTNIYAIKKGIMEVHIKDSVLIVSWNKLISVLIFPSTATGTATYSVYIYHLLTTKKGCKNN